MEMCIVCIYVRAETAPPFPIHPKMDNIIIIITPAIVLPSSLPPTLFPSFFKYRLCLYMYMLLLMLILLLSLYGLDCLVYVTHRVVYMPNKIPNQESDHININDI